MKKLINRIALIFCAILFCHACTSDSGKATDDFQNFNEANNFEDTRIGVVLGTTHDNYMSNNFPKAEIIRFNNFTDLAVALKANQCDLMMMDITTCKLYLQDDPELALFRDNVFHDSFGFGFNDETLQNQFNQLLDNLQQTGELQAIIDKWTNDDGTEEIPDFSDVPTDGELNIAIDAICPPFTYLSHQNFVGIDVEIAARFAAKLNKKPNILNVAFSSLIPSLASQKADLICSSISITEERAKQVKFSKPYYNSSANMITLKSLLPESTTKNQNIFASVDDLKTAKIAVLLGSTQEIYATKHFPDATILPIDAISDILTALTTNRCDAAIVSNDQAVFFMKEHPEFGYLEKNLCKDSISIGFRKDNLAMVQQFNDFLERIKASGLYQEIYDRWMGEQQGEMPVIENSGKNGTIVIGTEGQSVPNSFLKDGKIVGFDIEIIERFAAELGKKPELFISNFSGLIPALTTGKVEIIANDIMVTPERQKEVAFSNSYCNKITGIICNKKHLSQQSVPIKDGSDLATTVSGVMTGSIAELYMKERFPEADIQCFDDIMDAVTALKSNKLDYVMTAYTTAITVTKMNSDLVILPTEYTHEGAGIAFPKDVDANMLQQANRVIQEIKKDGTFDEMTNRWLKNTETKYTIPKIPVVENGKILRVGCAASREPMCFIQDNKIVGLDCELIERVAYQLGMKVEYVDMKFSALVAALTTHKVDAVVSNFTATKERKEKVSFSDVYFVNPQVLLTKNQMQPVVDETESWWRCLEESFYNNIIHEKRYLLIWDGLKVTCLISLLSVVLGTLLGSIICFMRMSKNILIQTIAKVYIDLLRGIPQVVLLMIMFYVVFASTHINGVMVASLTFAMNFAAYVSEMFRTAINGVGKGQSEAGIAMGFSKVKTFANIILPQAIQKVLPVYKGEFISLVKMTSIVGYIAVQDLTKVSDIIRSRTFDAFFPLIMVAILYFVLAWILTQLLTLVEIKTAPKRKKEIKNK